MPGTGRPPSGQVLDLCLGIDIPAQAGTEVQKTAATTACFRRYSYRCNLDIGNRTSDLRILKLAPQFAAASVLHSSASIASALS